MQVGEGARWAWCRPEEARAGERRGAAWSQGISRRAAGRQRASANLGSEAAAALSLSKPEMMMVRSTLAALAVTSTCSSPTPVTAATAAAMGASTELQAKAR